MAKFIVEIEVDEDQLRKARDEAGGDENEEITEAIQQELGWVNASGISVNSIEPKKEI